MSRLPASVDFLFFPEPSTKPIVCMDLINNLVEPDSRQLMDPLIPYLLEFLQQNHYVLILLSSTSERRTKELLGDLIQYFDEVVCLIEPRKELQCLGRESSEMIFFSANFSVHSKEWHVPFDMPLSMQNIQTTFKWRDNESHLQSVDGRIQPLQLQYDSTSCNRVTPKRPRPKFCRAKSAMSTLTKALQRYDSSTNLSPSTGVADVSSPVWSGRAPQQQDGNTPNSSACFGAEDARNLFGADASLDSYVVPNSTSSGETSTSHDCGSPWWPQRHSVSALPTADITSSCPFDSEDCGMDSPSPVSPLNLSQASSSPINISPAWNKSVDSRWYSAQSGSSSLQSHSSQQQQHDYSMSPARDGELSAFSLNTCSPIFKMQNFDTLPQRQRSNSTPLRQSNVTPAKNQISKRSPLPHRSSPAPTSSGQRKQSSEAQKYRSIVAQRIEYIKRKWNAERAAVYQQQRCFLFESSDIHPHHQQHLIQRAPMPEEHNPSQKLRYRPPLEDVKLPPCAKVLTLCVDLDGTLVHTRHSPQGLIVKIRPYTRHFLKELSKMKDKFEVILFTASSFSYASKVVKKLDSHAVIDHILHRVHCSQVDAHYVKELGRIGRENAIIIDDNYFSFLFNHEDAIPIESWNSDSGSKNDCELLHILEVIKNIHAEQESHKLIAREHINNYKRLKRTVS